MDKIAAENVQRFCDDVSILVEPILNDLTAVGFSFMRIYPDSSKVFLTDSLQWANYMIENNLFGVSDYQKFLDMPQYTLWRHWPQEDKIFQKFIALAKRDFGFDNSLNIIVPREDYLDSFCFRAKVDNEKINNIFLNKITEISVFLNRFTSESQHLLEAASKHKITFEEAEINLAESESSLANKLIYDPCNNKTFTAQESKCIALKYRGMNAQLISQELGISVRTVEHYFSNCLRKTSTNSIVTLMQKILDVRGNKDIIIRSIANE